MGDPPTPSQDHLCLRCLLPLSVPLTWLWSFALEGSSSQPISVPYGDKWRYPSSKDLPLIYV